MLVGKVLEVTPALGGGLGSQELGHSLVNFLLPFDGFASEQFLVLRDVNDELNLFLAGPDRLLALGFGGGFLVVEERIHPWQFSILLLSNYPQLSITLILSSLISLVFGPSHPSPPYFWPLFPLNFIYLLFSLFILELRSKPQPTSSILPPFNFSMVMECSAFLLFFRWVVSWLCVHTC